MIISVLASLAVELPITGKRKGKTNRNMKGQCLERQRVEGAEGGTCERPKQVATTGTTQADPVREHGDRRIRSL